MATPARIDGDVVRVNWRLAEVLHQYRGLIAWKSLHQYGIERFNLRREHKWIKAHLLTGTKTNMVIGASITDVHEGGDSPQFKPLIAQAVRDGFTIREICADKAYSSRENHDVARAAGATPYIPYRNNASGLSRGSMAWRIGFRAYNDNRPLFLDHYHQRSNAETTFYAIKQKFGDFVRSKLFPAQRNELLCKLIAYNLCNLVHVKLEHGVVVDFSKFN